jgi:1-acyl-sn-glycerol-3-phosphate acyltransferase
MSDKKRRSDSPTGSSNAPEVDASERLLRAEGADVPLRSKKRRRRPHPKQARSAEVVHKHAALTASDANIAVRIRELEERLDRMISEHAREHPAQTHREGPAPAPAPQAGSQAPRPATSSERPGTLAADVGARRELGVPGDFYLRKWGRLGLRSRSEEFDEFGYDPAYDEKVLPLFEFLYEKYFRVQTHRIERIPSEGRCLLVANHSGTLPIDGVMLRLAVRQAHPQHRNVRWLVEDAIFHFPFLGSFANRLGAVRACQENAERLLDHEALVAVFPEGMKGIGKLFRDRYKLQRFGRGGFVKLLLRTRTPVVPVAIVGGEEMNPMLARVEYLSKAFGMSYLPLTPTFPFLGPLGLLPAPTKWKIYFGEPMVFDSHGAEAADDEVLVGRLAERVRGEIQTMLDHALAERRSVWLG